ncbi:MAG: hypothetical protein WDO73_04185 [Ignavibacteriota bacterium]
MKALLIAAAFAALVIGFPSQSAAQASTPIGTHPIPRLVQQEGRYALMVDGAPYLMLGAQSGNSSNWPAALPKVWPAIEYLHANTLETPIYWEQLEPKRGSMTTRRSTCS